MKSFEHFHWLEHNRGKMWKLLHNWQMIAEEKQLGAHMHVRMSITCLAATS